jgi:hypothetical protein
MSVVSRRSFLGPQALASGMKSLNGTIAKAVNKTAAWFPYWVERELLVAPTQIPASVVRPAHCYLMKLAFEGAPLSFAAPMRSASGTSRLRSGSRAGSDVERGQELGTAPNRVPRQRRECRTAVT